MSDACKPKPPSPPPPLLTVGDVLKRQLHLRVVCGRTWRGIWIEPEALTAALARLEPSTTVAEVWLRGRFRCSCCPNASGRGQPAMAIGIYERFQFDRELELWRIGERHLPERLELGVYVKEPSVIPEPSGGRGPSRRR